MKATEALLRRLAVRRMYRAVPALLVGLVGLNDLLYGLLPRLPHQIDRLSRSGTLGPHLAGRLVSSMLGLALLLLGWLLWRGSKQAWMVAVVAIIADLVLVAVRLRSGWSALLPVAALVVLLATRTSYRLEVPVRRWWRLLIPVSLGVVWLVFGAVSVAEFEERHPRHFWQLLGAVFGLVASQPPTRYLPPYVLALQLGLVVVLGSALWAVAYSFGVVKLFPLAPPDHALGLFARRYGRSSAAPLLELPDNNHLPLCDGQAVAAVGLSNNVAVCLGAPVAPPHLEQPALAEFVDYCERMGWVPSLLSADERQKNQAAELGFRSLQVGQEAFIEVEPFTTAGKRLANVRHSVTKGRKSGLVVHRWSPELTTPGRVRQLNALSEEWVRTKGGPELGFTLGRFDPEALSENEAYVAFTGYDTPEERVEGFVTWLVYDDGDTAVLDLMRRADDCPYGVMDVLIVDSIADFQRRGRHLCSLGGVPFAGPEEREGRLQALLGWVYDQNMYSAQSLFKFKHKFNPDWRPVYLCYPATTDLLPIAVAILRCTLPEGTVRQALISYGKSRTRPATAAA